MSEMRAETKPAAPAQVIRDMYQAALDGDQERFLAFIAEDLVLYEPPYLPYGKDHHGVDGFKELFIKSTQVLNLPTMTVKYVFADQERACAVIECVGSPWGALSHFGLTPAPARSAKVAG
jgi:uncharacterized protein